MTPERQKPVLPLKRGMIYAATLNTAVGEKYWLVISNNLRNKNFGDVLAVRLTTTRKPPRSTRVALPRGEPLSGWVLCDDITTLYDDEAVAVKGGLSPAAMSLVDDGLKAALGLD